MAAVDKETAHQTTSTLEQWRQGDYSLNCGPLIVAVEADEKTPDELKPGYLDGYPGFAVISQSCDIVRPADKVPHVTVAPLVEVTPQHRDMIARGRAPRFASIENAPDGLVVDLAATMSVSKSLLTTWERHTGFDTTEGARRFAYGLERAFGRFAFPDDFNTSIAALRKKIQSKYGNVNSPLGKSLDFIQELRVRPSADWVSTEVKIKFFLIFGRGELEEGDVSEIIEEFEKAVKGLSWTGAFSLDTNPIRVGTYDDFSARDYVESVPLDLNALSFAEHYQKDSLNSAD